MYRIGFSQDSHNMVKGNGYTLGGVEIKSPYSIQAYSDGDVLIHAISESILGAIGLDDIGTYFNEKNKPQNFSSVIILKFALKQMYDAGYSISNLDVQIIYDLEILGKYKKMIKLNLSKVLNINLDQLAIKATTSEGFNPGQITAMSNVLIYKSEGNKNGY